MFEKQLLAVAVVSAGLLGLAPSNANEPSHGEKDARHLVYLERSNDWCLRHAPQKQAYRGWLRRELARQAFLIAAREEMGLATRDFWLGERPPADAGVVPLDIIGIPGSSNGKNRIELVKGPASQQELVGFIHVDGHDVKDYVSFVADCERLSREQFPNALKLAGYRKQQEPAQHVDDLALSEEIQELLAEMTFVAQFDALRRLHVMDREEGVSPATRCALVRAYAHAGVLTEELWRPMHQVFKARALLYAQRMVVQRPESSLAFATRAYALALAGVHHQALADLKRAAELRGDAEPPSWEPILEAYCRYDITGLRASDEHPQLSLLLQYLAYEQAGSDALALEIGVEGLSDRMPECYRLHCGLCRYSGVSLGHQVTVVGMQLMASGVYEQVSQVEGLPETVEEIVKQRARRGGFGGLLRREPGPEPEARRKLIEALAAHDDKGELSLAALSRWIDDTTLALIGNRAWFLNRQLGVAPDDFLDQVTPLFGDHRLAAIPNGFRWQRDQQGKAVQVIRQMSLREIEIQGRFALDVLRNHDDELRNRIFFMASERADYTAPGLSRWIKNLLRDFQAEHAPKLLAVSPHSPLAKAVLVERKWDDYKQHAKQWEEDALQHPQLAIGMARQYRDQEKFDEAERMFRAAIKLSPRHDSYMLLASMYYNQKQYERWKDVLEEFLEQPGGGLEHAKANQLIAYYYMRRRQFEEALPYAELAAASYSEWGLETAGRCHERLGNWEEAEAYYAAVSLRYRFSEHNWYLFCRGTGKGDIEAAKEAMMPVWERIDHGESSGGLSGLLHLLEGRDTEALKQCEKEFAEDFDPVVGLLGAVLADRLNENKRRDELLEGVRAKGGEFRTSDGNNRKQMQRLAELFIEDLRSGGKASFDIKAAEKICTDAYELDRLTCACLLAEYLDIHGKPDQAKRFWARCAESVERSYLQRLACLRLLSHDVKAEDFSTLVDKSQDEQWRLD